MKIPHFSGLCPPPPFKNSTYTVICYLPTLWVLVRERVLHGKISGGSQKYRKGVDHRKGRVPLERGGCKVVPSYDQLRSLPYRVKIQDVYKVPSQCNFQNRSYSNQDEEDQLPSAVNLPEHDSIPEHDSTLGTEGNRSSLQPQDSDIPEEITCPPWDNDLGMTNTPERSSEAVTNVSRRNPPKDRRHPNTWLTTNCRNLCGRNPVYMYIALLKNWKHKKGLYSKLQ